MRRLRWKRAHTCPACCWINEFDIGTFAADEAVEFDMTTKEPCPGCAADIPVSYLFSVPVRELTDGINREDTGGS